MTLHSVVIAQFAKTPIEGQVKTRLIGHLSPRQACQLHKNLLTTVANEISRYENVHRQIWSTAGGEYILTLADSLSLEHKVQQGEDLGQRLTYAVNAALDDHDAVIVVGSDCPFIDEQYYRSAIDALFDGNHDLVIGPANDGGYVLIGMAGFYPEVFRDIEWGSAQVFERTLVQAARVGLRVGVLDTLSDIDRPEDLRLLPERLLKIDQ